MKKTIMIGALATALIASGGTGLYMAYAKELPTNPNTLMQGQAVGYGQMKKMMETGNMEDMKNFMNEQGVDYEEMQKFMENGNMNYGQMKSYMSKMHPDLTNQELEAMYKGMHGTGGASQSRNF
ncbi:hypothetical protein [Niallia oryzisoli]|uniref:hypothetical protein n=1 Tax=Niallia oryzisoli TaxID=1737571 RepID=UPI0037365D05